jgi:hypothetical protein
MRNTFPHPGWVVSAMSKEIAHPVDPSVLREMYSYDPETGSITDRRTGRPALTGRASHGYLTGKVLGKKYRAHRVAWALHHGKWPDDEVDHNRIANLRDCDHMTNTQNRNLNRRNRTGFRGIALHPDNPKPYRVRIKINGQNHCFGSHSTLAEAIAARRAAEIEHGLSLD